MSRHSLPETTKSKKLPSIYSVNTKSYYMQKRQSSLSNYKKRKTYKTLQVGPKKPIQNYQNIVLNRIKACQSD